MAQTTGGMPSQDLSRRAKASLWRSTISGVTRLWYSMRTVGAATVAVPVISGSPLRVTWQSKSISKPASRLARAVTVPMISSPTATEPV